MHILVTSAGSALAQRVIQGLAVEHDVRATERQPVAGVDALAVSPLGHDLSTHLLVRDMDAIVHCAEALPGEIPASYLDYTTRCTYNLLLAASQEGVARVIFLSTLELLAAYPVDYAVTERWKPLPNTNPGMLGKHLGEMVCREFAREFKIQVVVLRVGEWVGDGTAPRDSAVSSEDEVQAIERALTAQLPRWSVFHIQGEFPGARFAVRDAKAKLGFVPSNPFPEAYEGVTE